MWLIGAKCGCSEEVHQHSLCPSRVLPFSLSRHKHSLSGGCFLCPIATGLATSMQVTPLLWHWGGPAWGGGRGGVESFSLLPTDVVAELRRGALPLQPNFTVTPLISASPPHQEEGTQMGEGSGFHPALKCLQNINQARAQLECELA